VSAGRRTPDEYGREVGGDARVVPAGELTIDGMTTVRSVLRLLILDPKHPATTKSTAVKLWIHAHECGHQFRGHDEETADCFAVQRGAATGLAHARRISRCVCKVMAGKGRQHAFHGTQRCDAMKACYADRPIRSHDQRDVGANRSRISRSEDFSSNCGG
jgi:hypothetical protein